MTNYWFQTFFWSTGCNRIAGKSGCRMAVGAVLKIAFLTEWTPVTLKYILTYFYFMKRYHFKNSYSRFLYLFYNDFSYEDQTLIIFSSCKYWSRGLDLLRHYENMFNQRLIIIACVLLRMGICIPLGNRLCHYICSNLPNNRWRFHNLFRDERIENKTKTNYIGNRTPKTAAQTMASNEIYICAYIYIIRFKKYIPVHAVA